MLTLTKDQLMNIDAWNVSDTQSKDFPTNELELKRRLEEISEWVPQPRVKVRGNNIAFSVLAFELFKDCGLINQENIDFLSSGVACNNTFYQVMNPEGGILSKYCTGRHYDSIKNPRTVTFKGQKYYINSEWYEANKREFLSWLTKKAEEACKKQWAQKAANDLRSIFAFQAKKD